MSPLRRLLLRDLLFLVGSLAVVLLALSWWGFQRATHQQARALARQARALTQERLHRRFGEYRQAVDQMDRMLRSGAMDLGRPETLHRGLVGLVPPGGRLRSLGLVTPEGLIIDVAPDGRGKWITDINPNLLQGGLFTSWDWSEDGSLRTQHGRVEAGGPQRDVRVRPWYLLALEHPEGAWTEPFLFQHDSPVSDRIGMTFARQHQDASGNTLAILEVSILLDDLGDMLEQSLPFPGCQVLVEDRRGHAVLLRGPDLALDAATARRALQEPFHEGFLPQAKALKEAAGDSLRLGRERYVVERVPLDEIRGLGWTVYLGVPAAPLLEGPLRIARTMALVSLACALLLGWRIVVIAHRFSHPLRILTESSEAATHGAPFEVPATDIEEIRRLGQSFEEASASIRHRALLEAELRHAQRVITLGTLAGGVAHDVNNFLTGASLELEYAQEAQNLPPEHTSILRRIQKALGASAQLLKGLLRFGHAGPSRYEPIQLNEIVRATADLLRPALGGSISVELDLDPDLPLVSGEGLQLMQVLMNLGINARDAMPQGGALRFRTRAEGGQVLVEVEDTGTGIPPEVLRQLFQPFFTTKEAGKGTGLGMAIVQGVVEAHQGQVEVRSEVGVGTTFTLRLPRMGQA